MSTVEHTNQVSLPIPSSKDDCPRCGGLMVPEVFPELNLRWSEAAAERCVLCGEIVDSVILQNRLRCPNRAETEQDVQPWHL